MNTSRHSWSRSKVLGLLVALSVSVAVNLVAAQPASAALLNFGFEDGVDAAGHPVGWQTTFGNVAVVGADTFKGGSPGFAPFGNFQLRASTVGSGPSDPIQDLFGLTPVDGVTGGSAVFQEFTVEEPATLFFSMIFVTERDRTAPIDIAFVSVVEIVPENIGGLGSRLAFFPFESSDEGNELVPDDSGVLFRRSAFDPTNLFLQFVRAGTYRVGMGILNTGSADVFGESRVYVDASVQPAPPAVVPEPATMSLMTLGLVALRCVRGRRRA